MGGMGEALVLPNLHNQTLRCPFLSTDLHAGIDALVGNLDFAFFMFQRFCMENNLWPISLPLPNMNT
jgi:hypothetical protein